MKLTARERMGSPFFRMIRWLEKGTCGPFRQQNPVGSANSGHSLLSIRDILYRISLLDMPPYTKPLAAPSSSDFRTFIFRL